MTMKRTATMALLLGLTVAVAGCLQAANDQLQGSTDGATGAPPAGSVGTEALQDGAVTADKIGANCSDGQILKVQTGAWRCAPDETGAGGGGGGDVTGVTAGAGLAGGGDSGDVTLRVDTSSTQARVSGACSSGEAIRVVNEDGTVTCESVGGGGSSSVDAWALGGNSGLDPATDWLGTSDGTPLVIKANGTQVARYEAAEGEPNVILGAEVNSIEGDHQLATIGGGGENKVGGRSATVGGGIGNTADGHQATVGGGAGNVAEGLDATVSGGRENKAISKGATVSGGHKNAAGGLHATVPGGHRNLARDTLSFAAGAGATADHEGAFVWSDSSKTDDHAFVSTGKDQFLVEAHGGVGVGTNAPEAQLHVTDSLDATASSLDAHVAAVENTNTGNGPDVLGLKIGTTGDPGGAANFLSFYDGEDDLLGQVDADGSGGVSYKSASADFAEYLPKAPGASGMEPGDVVGLVDGELRTGTEGASEAFVVSRSPIVLGNTVEDAPEDGGSVLEDHAAVALLGQVETKVAGPVEAGDVLVPSGAGDGAAVAVDEAPEAREHLVLGRALEDKPGDGEGSVNVLVSPPSPVSGTTATTDAGPSGPEGSDDGEAGKGQVSSASAGGSAAGAGMGLAEVVAASLGSSAATLAGGAALLRVRER